MLQLLIFSKNYIKDIAEKKKAALQSECSSFKLCIYNLRQYEKKKKTPEVTPKNAEQLPGCWTFIISIQLSLDKYNVM